MIGEGDIAACAKALEEASREGKAMGQLTETHKDLTVGEAYTIQEKAFGILLETRKERPVGVKLGLTSRAKMEQVGVDEPILGRLSSGMAIPDGGTVRLSGRIHPRVEPEVALRVAAGAGGGAGARFDAVAPALEIIDSRYENFRFRLEDVVADNASASGFVCGPWVPPGADLSNLGVVLGIDGRVAHVGSTAAVLGDCRRSLALAESILERRGQELEPGWVVLVGSPVEAVELAPGAFVRAEFEAIGNVSVRAERGGKE